MNLVLDKYPDFNFDIEGTSYYAINLNRYLTKVKTGDTLFLDIKTDVYQKKLSKEKELSFSDKTVNYRKIYVYELKDKNRSYMALKDNNNDRNEWGHYFWGIIGLFFIGCGVYLSFEKSVKSLLKKAGM